MEYVDGQQFASVVVTGNAWSDWSVVSINAPGVLKLRIKRENEVVHINFTEGEEGNSKMMRLDYLPVIDRSQKMMVGNMCTSPVEDAQGFDISFEDLSIVNDNYRSGTIRVCCHYMFLCSFTTIIFQQITFCNRSI